MTIFYINSFENDYDVKKNQSINFRFIKQCSTLKILR